MKTQKLSEIDADYPNLRVALHWSGTSDVETQLRLAAALGYFWD